MYDDGIIKDEKRKYVTVEQENIYIGYKYYETRYADCVMGEGNADSEVGTFRSNGGWNYAEEMCFPFGFGMSYTTFAQSIEKVTFEEETD